MHAHSPSLDVRACSPARVAAFHEPPRIRHSVPGTLRQEVLIDGRHRLVTDEPESVGGDGSAPAPHELFPAALAACIATTLVMYGRTKHWELGDVDVDVEYDHRSTPRRFTIDIRLGGYLTRKQLEILEKVAAACRVRRGNREWDRVRRAHRAAAERGGRMTKRRIVVLGGGTGGTMVANRLRRQYDRHAVEIHVVDRDDRHVYQPGLLLVPFGLAGVDEIVRPRRRQLRARISFHESDVAEVRIDRHEVLLLDGTRWKGSTQP
jgi:uncharacterized OsmC-like protein